MISTTKELYGISKEELMINITYSICQIINSNLDNNTMGEMICKTIKDTRIKLLKVNRDELLKNGILALTKTEDRIVNDIDKAINFWNSIGDN